MSAVMPDREGQKAATHGRKFVGAIIRDRKNQKAAIHGSTLELLN